MYRSNADLPVATGDVVTIRRYFDVVEAQMARAQLSADGIEAHVLEATSFNPLLSDAAGGVQLQVRESDAARATAILHEKPGEDPPDDGEGSDVVRCPRCELAYCYHERARLRGSNTYPGLAIFTLPFLVFAPKRWHCHKCGHAWDDPKEGPQAMTPLGPDDPRPVFRLRRAHTGMGLFLGVMGGMIISVLAALVMPSMSQSVSSVLTALGPIVFLGSIALGWYIGRSARYDLCSEPACRTPLGPEAEICSRCRGAVAGVVHSAEEHFSAAAEFRRELAELNRKPRRRKAGKKKPSRRASGRGIETPSSS